jgi:hypothetical protein
MAASLSISPALGVDTSGVYKSGDYNYSRIPLGTVVRAQNGRMYTYVQASAGVADATAGTITEPAFTFAGAGATPNWTTRTGAVSTGDRFWVESNAI